MSSVETRLAPRADAAAAFRVEPAKVSDHGAVHELLWNVFGSPNYEQFQLQQEDPHYQPSDRLLVRSGRRLAAHALLAQRQVVLHGQTLPARELKWFGCLPEYRGRGIGRQLLQATASRVTRDKSLFVGTVATRVGMFQEFGWIPCGDVAPAAVCVRELLSRLPRGAERMTKRSLRIRYWKHFELPALMRIHRQNMATRGGVFERDEVYWRWLIARAAFDQILVALDGPDHLDLHEERAPIVGYAVLRGDQLLELCTTPAHGHVALALLARIGGEMLERGQSTLRVFDHALRRSSYLAADAPADGSSPSRLSRRRMVLAPRPFSLLRSQRSEMFRRARRASLTAGTELGIDAGRSKVQLQMTRRSIRFQPGRLGRSYARCTPEALTRLLIGQSTVDQEIASGDLTTSTRTARDVARVLFPEATLHFPSWDYVSM